VTLTATAKAGSAHPAGHVQFEVGGADIGSPVAVDATGVATTFTTFAVPGTERLSAQFTPTSAGYTASTGTFSLVVGPVPANIAGVETISVTVPQTGFFTVSFKPGPVELKAKGSTATGALGDVTVTDTRNYHPGWSLSGQASAFTSDDDDDSRTVPGKELGWVPTVVGSLHDGAQLGASVAPAHPGLGAAPATLAYAAAGCGYGTNILSAKLTLDIPRTEEEEGRYSGVVTITYVESGPAPAGDDQASCGKSAKPPGDR
jgi:Bacterial Ig-like domain (group 3)